MAVGRIYETRAGPDRLRWFWSFTVTCPMTHSDRVEEAKAQFRKSWDAWEGVGGTGDDEMTWNSSHGERGHV